MKILVTGAAGMLGVDLCQELEKSHKVFAADIKKPLLDTKAKCLDNMIDVDIANRASIYQHILSTGPDAVVHCAAYTDVDACELNKEKAFYINANGAKNVADACKDAGAMMVYISTDFVFDGKKSAPYDEGDKPDPINIYGLSKLGGEESVKAALNRYLIIRTSWTFGKNGKNFVESILKKARSGQELIVVNDQIGSPTFTRDLSSAIKDLLEKVFIDNSLFGIYHITNSGKCSRHEEALKILELSEIKDVKIKAISSDKTHYPAKRPFMSVLDCGKFAKITGKKLRNWQEALKDYLK